MNARTPREAKLEGTQAAKRLHLDLRTRERVERGDAADVDVFAAAAELGAALLFRPLDGLLGAYLGPPIFDAVGIIVSTQRDLHVQRFTVAHEIGHLVMAHTPSLDTQVGLWRGESSDLQELAADAFASEFLLPKWLYVLHAARKNWSKADLNDPAVVYQLALRMGASYEATCWGLGGHKILPADDAARLRGVPPKKIKQQLLRGLLTPDNYRLDVWAVNANDHLAVLRGAPDDLLVFSCQEHAASGYVWDTAALNTDGVELLVDRRTAADDTVGGSLTRTLVARAAPADNRRIEIREARPWNPRDRLSTLAVTMDTRGKEIGLARRERQVQLWAV